MLVGFSSHRISICCTKMEFQALPKLCDDVILSLSVKNNVNKIK